MTDIQVNKVWLPPHPAGTANVTQLFEGQQNHLIPCGLLPLMDNDLFVVAGRVTGHSSIGVQW